MQINFAFFDKFLSLLNQGEHERHPVLYTYTKLYEMQKSAAWFSSHKNIFHIGGQYGFDAQTIVKSRLDHSQKLVVHLQRPSRF